MKTIFNKIIFGALALVLFAGCEDNEKSPLPVPRDGSFVTIEFDNLILDVQDLANSSITGTLKAPVANVASYDLEVSRTSGGVTSAFVPVFSTSTFPADFSITPESIATALGLTTMDLTAGDRFDFQATSTSTDGEVTDWSVLNADLQGEPGQLQSYQFTSFISCPFVQADALGTYTIIEDDGFGLNGVTEFEVVAGENTGEIVMINPFGGTEAYDISIDVDPFGIATIPDGQNMFSTLEQCCAGFGPTFTDDSPGGFVFSCAGSIIVTFDTLIEQDGTGALFTFGSIPFEAQKQ